MKNCGKYALAFVCVKAFIYDPIAESGMTEAFIIMPDIQEEQHIFLNISLMDTYSTSASEK